MSSALNPTPPFPVWATQRHHCTPPCVKNETDIWYSVSDPHTVWYSSVTPSNNHMIGQQWHRMWGYYLWSSRSTILQYSNRCDSFFNGNIFTCIVVELLLKYCSWTIESQDEQEKGIPIFGEKFCHIYVLCLAHSGKVMFSCSGYCVRCRYVDSCFQPMFHTIR